MRCEEECVGRCEEGAAHAHSARHRPGVKNDFPSCVFFFIHTSSSHLLFTDEFRLGVAHPARADEDLRGDPLNHDFKAFLSQTGFVLPPLKQISVHASSPPPPLSPISDLRQALRRARHLFERGQKSDRFFSWWRSCQA